MVKYPEERVSTVGIRNQVTLPKPVRKQLRVTDKTTAYIRAGPDNKHLLLSLEPPENSVFGRIKISEKGQLVIPKNYRESMGISEGVNLVFRTAPGNEIAVQKLVERTVSPVSNKWQFLVRSVETFSTFKHIENISVEGTGNKLALVLGFTKPLTPAVIQQVIEAVEDLTGTRCMVERLDGDKSIKLTSLVI